MPFTMSCVICKSEIEKDDSVYFSGNCRWNSGPLVGLTAKSEEVEQMSFPQNKQHQSMCMSLYRAILERTDWDSPRISGIVQRLPMQGLPYSVLSDPRSARIGFHPSKLTSLDFRFWVADEYPRSSLKPGECVGYPIHMTCWVLLGRFLGKEVLEANLSCLLKTVKQAQTTQNGRHPLHSQTKKQTQFDVAPWLKCCSGPPSDRCEWKMSCKQMSPVVIPELRDLIARASRHGTARAFPKCMANIPVEIRIMIVEMIYKQPGYCQARIRETKNMLRAFGWRLPDSYWQERCIPRLVFEIQDLIQAGRVVDWKYLCLGLEELVFKYRWYAGSGLRNRARICKKIEGIRTGFQKMLDDNRREKYILNV
ncbi:hypothetical protein BO71DRAFT_401263 [Aspergillus ellipticus CBS 707.79]|uniref:Uncharacterized protein n=1 Tax=Aspergillus ellipticus CBS 707.79 TaxID=1448320 RepID=A0A319D2U0_9EURO|nr:hypothetical protein BO71DRAFT_401263 [Aspergillus ellipticus CBS 707.79]